MEEFLIDEFYEKMDGINLEAYGIIDSENKIHTLGTDSKIIGRIFEMFTQPVLSAIAAEHGMLLKTPASQTVYPDFIMMRGEDSTEKIAIDVKSTYVAGNRSKIKFTLGSYGSYMRNNTKNIEYCYTDYAKHYVIGFVYMRNGAAQESLVYDYDRREEILFPYREVGIRRILVPSRPGTFLFGARLNATAPVPRKGSIHRPSSSRRTCSRINGTSFVLIPWHLTGGTRMLFFSIVFPLTGVILRACALMWRHSGAHRILIVEPPPPHALSPGTCPRRRPGPPGSRTRRRSLHPGPGWRGRRRRRPLAPAPCRRWRR